MNYRRSPKPLLLIWLTILIALLLEIAPIPMGWARPFWLLAVILFWVVQSPNNLGLVAICLLGLLMDALTGSLLGEHVCAYLITAYLVMAFQVRIKLFPHIQQALIVLLLAYVYAVVFSVIQSLIHQPIDSVIFWFVPWLTAIIWLGFAQVMHRRLGVYDSL